MTDSTTRTTSSPQPSWREAQRILIDEIREHGRPQTGWFAGRQVLLLTTTGARSGEPRLSPLAYSRDGDSYVVTASKGGAPTHPAWYHNLLRDPIVTIEADGDSFRARARVVDGVERQRLWDRHVALHTGIAAYPKKTERVIPVVVFERADQA